MVEWQKKDLITMKRPQEEENEKLHHQLQNLQQDWDSFKQSNPGSIHRCSADSKSSPEILRLLDNWPTNLKSSLQHRQSPTRGGVWKVRNNELAVEEILSERRAAIESGKLKGRRLRFEALEGASEMELGGREEICSGCSVLIQCSEVRSLSSYSSDDLIDNDDQSVCGYCYSSSVSSVSVENVEREKVVVEGVGEKSVVGVDRGRLMVVMGWLAIVLMVLALGIISLGSFDRYGDEDIETLIPT